RGDRRSSREDQKGVGAEQKGATPSTGRRRRDMPSLGGRNDRSPERCSGGCRPDAERSRKGGGQERLLGRIAVEDTRLRQRGGSDPMLGEMIGEETGKITGTRVLPSEGGGPKVETSFQGTGRYLGIEVTDIGTYWAVMRPDGTLYGEGQGVVMAKDGGMA